MTAEKGLFVWEEVLEQEVHLVVGDGVPGGDEFAGDVEAGFLVDVDGAGVGGFGVDEDLFFVGEFAE